MQGATAFDMRPLAARRLRFAGAAFLLVVVAIIPLEARENPPYRNKGFQVPGIGICLIRNLCLVDHPEFKVIQLNLLMGDSWGFSALQLGTFRNRAYGPTGLQFAFANQSGRDVTVPVQLGIYNMQDDGGLALLQLGVFANLSHRETTVAGVQLSGVLNLEDRDSAGPNIYGLQLSGGLNRASNVVGVQLGLDIHWLFAIFFENRKEYYSSAQNVYGLKFSLITGEVRENMGGVQGGLFNRTKSLWGIQLGLGNTVTDAALGLQFGAVNSGNAHSGAMLGLVNVAGGDTDGIQLGLYNSAGRIRPLQIGGMNHTRSLVGVQLGLLNRSETKAFGLQCCGFNTVDARLSGVQLGIYNRAEQAFAQLGLLNSSDHNPVIQLGGLNLSDKNSEGVQFGLFNYTSGRATLQIGLLNFALKNFLPFFPIININLEEDAAGGRDLDREMARLANVSTQ